jgi:hypothetical protein
MCRYTGYPLIWQDQDVGLLRRPPDATQAASPKEDAVWEGVQRVAGVLDAGRSFWTGETARSESFSEREMWEA